MSSTKSTDPKKFPPPPAPTGKPPGRQPVTTKDSKAPLILSPSKGNLLHLDKLLDSAEVRAAARYVRVVHALKAYRQYYP